MSEPANPFALNLFESLNPICCSRCDVELQPEEAHRRVKTVVQQGFLGEQEHQVRDYFCGRCLKFENDQEKWQQVLLRIERRQKKWHQILVYGIAGTGLLLALLSKLFW